MEYKLSNHCCYNINYHIVFCPKRRKRVFVGDIVADAENKIRRICEEIGVSLENISIMPDHVHLFVSAPPTINPQKIVKRIKGSTARYLRDKYPNLMKIPCMWSPSYYIGTVGFVSESVVKQYIENQKTK